MDRISSARPSFDAQRNLRRKEAALNKAENRIMSQSRIQSLRDDPIAAGHLVRNNSFAERLDQFGKNAATIVDRVSYSEGYISSNLQILHRVRELAVTGATGTFSAEDLQAMASEVNQHLLTMISNANAVGPEGTSLFAGTRGNGQAFEVVEGNIPGCREPVVTEVSYCGNIEKSQIEVDERQTAEYDRAGCRIFWAERQKIFSNRDTSQFSVQADCKINVDGCEIPISAGDNMHSIIAKINNSGAAVKAQVDPVSGGVNLQTTDARQLWLEDLGNGTVLQDLGLIQDKSQRPPNNLNQSATVSGGSLFDSVIALRDALYAGDHEAIGGRILGSLDSALNNLTGRLAESGALYDRLQTSIARTNKQIPDITARIAREGDVDFAQAMTEMKMLDYAKQAALNAASKLYDNTILNYIK